MTLHAAEKRYWSSQLSSSLTLRACVSGVIMWCDWPLKMPGYHARGDKRRIGDPRHQSKIPHLFVKQNVVIRKR
jgi:hypothetical protein